jgi:hypothetical protein
MDEVFSCNMYISLTEAVDGRLLIYGIRRRPAVRYALTASP